MKDSTAIPSLLRAFLDASDDATVVLDEERRILYYNTAYASLLGGDLVELRKRVERGDQCKDILPLSICKQTCAAERAKSTLEAVTLESSASRNLSVRAVVGDDGLIIETYKDVGKVDRHENHLNAELSRERQVNAGLEETVKSRTDQLNAAHEQLVLQEKMSALGRLVAGIAHELNNPINFVYGNVEFLDTYMQDLLSLVELVDTSGALPPGLRERFEERKAEVGYDYLRKDCSKLIESVRVGAERSASIVRDLKNFSRSQATSLHTFDLIRGVEATLNLIGPLIKNRIEIRRNYEQDIPTILCNGGHINQVFMNLLANAAQAIEGKGWIEISIDRVDDKQVRIRVADSGHGISEADQVKITDPFFTTKEVGEGSGLGLWITLGIIHRHQGMFICDSAPGSGAVFTVTLPISPVVANTEIS